MRGIDVHLPRLFSELPWPARLALIGGGTCVSAFSGRLPEAWQDVGLYCGFAALIYGTLASVWHWINVWRKNRGAQEIVLGGTHLIVFLLTALIIGGGVFLWSTKTKNTAVANLQAEIHDKDTTIADLQTKLSESNEFAMTQRKEKFELANELGAAKKELEEIKNKNSTPPDANLSTIDSPNAHITGNIDECGIGSANNAIRSPNSVVEGNYRHCAHEGGPLRELAYDTGGPYFTLTRAELKQETLDFAEDLTRLQAQYDAAIFLGHKTIATDEDQIKRYRENVFKKAMALRSDIRLRLVPMKFPAPLQGSSAFRGRIMLQDGPTSKNNLVDLAEYMKFLAARIKTDK